MIPSFPTEHQQVLTRVRKWWTNSVIQATTRVAHLGRFFKGPKMDKIRRGCRQPPTTCEVPHPKNKRNMSGYLLAVGCTKMQQDRPCMRHNEHNDPFGWASKKRGNASSHSLSFYIEQTSGRDPEKGVDTSSPRGPSRYLRLMLKIRRARASRCLFDE